MPRKTKKLRYRLLRALTHPQLYSLIVIVIVIVAWVHWRRPVGELKLNPWVAVIFLAIIFRPALVELMRRTDKISTAWAEFTMKRLEEDVEKAEELNETNDPKPIEASSGIADECITDEETGTIQTPDRSVLAGRLTAILDQLPKSLEISFSDLQLTYRSHRRDLLRQRRDEMTTAAHLVLRQIGYPGFEATIDHRIGGHLTLVTRMTGWDEVANVWQSAEARYAEITDRSRPNRPSAEERMEAVLWSHLANNAMRMLKKQIVVLGTMVKFDRGLQPPQTDC